MATHPVIFVHGIQGSWLKNQYPVDYNNAIVWTGVLRKDFDAIHLHPLDATVDASADSVIMPHQAVPMIYEDIVSEIRDEMDDRPYAYVFTYDWRKDNRLSAAALAVFIERVLDIAGVHEKAAGRKRPRQVVLIGHSMGGLVIKWCATQIIPATRISKIITIATPLRGSLKAVEAILPGARNLFGMEHKKSMRHAARTLPGMYQILPSWDQAVVDSRTGEHIDIFEPTSWQPNLRENLTAKYGADFFPAKLADARAFSSVITKPWPENLPRKTYYAYGVGSDTWRQVKVKTHEDNFFLFTEADEDEQGDGTVHTLSSLQPEVTGGQRVFEDKKHPVRDMLAGQHANMPNHGELQDWILGILKVNPYPDDAFDSPI